MEFGSFNIVRRILLGYEMMNIINLGQIVGVEKKDVLGKVKLITQLFGVAA